MTDRLFDPGDDGELVDDAGTWLLDLVAAVDFLRRGHRPGFGVWDAVEEALRWAASASDDESFWNEPDPLERTLRHFLDAAAAGGPVAAELQRAVRRWVTAMAERYNNGHHWPHPQPRRGFPPPLHSGAVPDQTPPAPG